MLRKLFVTLISISLLYIGGCTDNPTNPVTGGTLTLNVTGLGDLGAAALYEGWIIVNGNPQSTGTFSINSSGQMSKTGFDVDQTALNSAMTFVLTIEPVPDPSASPSGVKILAGDFSGNTATLTISHSAALGNDFSSATGNYILATPTNGDNNDELSGIWFVMLPPPPSPGLNLPNLPAGWIYEGWAIVPGNNTPLSTGKFSSTTAADNSAPYSGPMAGPPFPGEDLLVNAPSGFTFPTNLQNGMAVITVEPVPDNDSAPFSLKPLTGSIPPNATDHTNYSMTNQSANNPTGTATR